MKQRQVQLRSLEFRGKVYQIEAATFFYLCPGWWSLSVSWAVDISPWSTVAQIPSRLLAVLLGHKGGAVYGLLESRGGHTFSSWNNSFLRALITELISQLVPKLKFSNSSVCHQYVLPCFEVMYCWVTCSLPVFFYHSKKQKSLIFVTVSRHLFNFMLIRKTCFDSIQLINSVTS